MTFSKLTPETMSFETMEQLDAAMAVLMTNIDKYEPEELEAVVERLQSRGQELAKQSAEMMRYLKQRKIKRSGMTVIK